MSAQANFLRGMHGFRLAQQHEALVEKAPDEREHNLRSKALRNGIAIIGFSILEHFIRARTGELLLSFDRVSISFEDLPNKIKEIATKGAVKGIAARMKYNDNAIAFTQTESAIIASSLKTTYQISQYSIGWDGSNLNVDDIGNIFKCFNIEAGWLAIDTLSGRLDLAILSSKEAFKNAAQRRHDAAHNIDAEIQPGHLESFVREAYVIALGFDLLSSTAYHKIYIGDNNYLNSVNKITAGDIALRTISLDGNRWKEFREGGRRAVRTAETKEELWPNALVRAGNNNEFLLCMDSDGFPSEWEFPSLL
ncbi:MAG: hypothetical protein E3J72_12080 [Planctomycetota bacterium]|nr:MAG: hypothetical protein E3J72_12080 [Planctomycetota bacterium]